MGTRETIIDRSLELFAVHGFEAVSVSMITGAVGIAKSTLYSHFRTKEEILETIIGRFEDYRRNLSGKNGDPLADALEQFSVREFWHHVLEAYLARWDDPFLKNFNRLMMIDQFRNARIADFVTVESAEALSAVETALSRMMEAGRIRQDDPGRIAAMFHYGLRGLLSEYDALIAHRRNTEPLRERMRLFVDGFTDLLVLPETS